MPERAVIHVTAVSGRTLLRLKSWLPEHVSGEKSVLLAGQQLPSQVGAISSIPVRALCLGPGEWLIVQHEHAVVFDVPAQGLALVDLSDGVASLEVSGSAVREVLSKGCGLDLHPRSFPPGRCARTRLAQIPLVIECLEQSRFELHVARSYRHYLHSWFTDAAADVS